MKQIFRSPFKVMTWLLLVTWSIAAVVLTYMVVTVWWGFALFCIQLVALLGMMLLPYMNPQTPRLWPQIRDAARLYYETYKKY